MPAKNEDFNKDSETGTSGTQKKDIIASDEGVPSTMDSLKLTAPKKVPTVHTKTDDAVISPSKGVQSSFDMDHESVVTRDTGDRPTYLHRLISTFSGLDTKCYSHLAAAPRERKYLNGSLCNAGNFE
jgi:hypothetical protein